MNSLGIIYRQLNTSTNESFLELFSGTGKEKGQILARNFQNGTFSARIINLGQLGRTKYTLNKSGTKKTMETVIIALLSEKMCILNICILEWTSGPTTPTEMYFIVKD